ncbi:unnamed protein product [Sphacelaria rigidula]
MALRALSSQLRNRSSRTAFALSAKTSPQCVIPAPARPASTLARSPHVPLENKAMMVERILHAKWASRKTYDEIASEMGLTNAYVAQLFLNQAQLKPERVAALRKAVPDLTDDDVEYMQRCPSFDDAVREEPLVYRLEEAVLHYGEVLLETVK